MDEKENKKEEKKESKPMDANYARGTVGEKTGESWTCHFCGMSNKGAFCDGCGTPRG